MKFLVILICLIVNYLWLKDFDHFNDGWFFRFRCLVEDWASNRVDNIPLGWLAAFILIYGLPLASLALTLFIAKGSVFGLVTMMVHILVMLVAFDRTQPGQLAKDFLEKFTGGDMDACIDFLDSSANKCIEGVPGFSFVIAKRDPLFANESTTRSLSLDLAAQLRGFEKNGQFRYSPPTHSLLAFEQALNELDSEGGVEGRALRYKRNHEVLMSGMESLGFKSYLDAKIQSYLITSFHFPEDSKFTFDVFYRKLSDRGMIIYPGKISQVDLFRIGSIGRIFESDVLALVASIKGALEDMNVSM